MNLSPNAGNIVSQRTFERSLSKVEIINYLAKIDFALNDHMETLDLYNNKDMKSGINPARDQTKKMQYISTL